MRSARLPKQRRTRLERRRVRKVYLDRMADAYSQFVAWLTARGVAAVGLEEAPLRLDGLLAEFTDSQFSLGAPVWIAKHAGLHLQFWHKTLKGKLGRVWDAIRSWEQIRGSKPRTPITEPMVLYAFLRGLEAASMAESPAVAELWALAAILLRVGFYSLLRPVEMLTLRVEDIRVFAGLDGVLTGVIAIREPKTRGW